jgi:hypothetical protein
MKNIKILAYIAVIVCIASHMQAIDNYHFYRASYFFGEPRLEKKGLSTLEIALAGGSTSQGINGAGKTVPLFHIHGPANMRILGNGIPINPDNPADMALINLAKEANCDCFAFLSFPGTFSILETDFNFFQNFKRGFFTQLYIPIRRIKSQPDAFIDLSPEMSSYCPNKSTPAWITFLDNFNDILSQYNLIFAGTNGIGFGDVSLLCGWTHNYQNTEILDYVDITIKGGVLFPTGKAKNENRIFSIPFGYDKHVGFPMLFDCSLGAYEWLTFGFHAQALPFLARCKEARIKTDFNQSGLIKLAKTPVLFEQGPIWSLGTYAKADHLGPGLSFLLGYTFASKERDTLWDAQCPPSSLFNPEIVNSDEILQGWHMSTMHLLVEYDFSKEGMCVGPRLGFLLNAIVGGKHIFKTNMIGGYFGIDVDWAWD